MTQTVLSAKEAKVIVPLVLAYITFYALEAPIRYGLALTGLNQLILFRDLLTLLPLAFVAIRQFLQKRFNPILAIFAFVLVLQSMIGYETIHAAGPVVLGAKLFVNVALGLLFGGLLINCSGRTRRYLNILLIISCAALFVEKFITPYPWVGMSTVIGGIDVPISLDWQSGDGIENRVGGFTRVSINAASLLPFLGLLLAPKWKSGGWRAITLLLTIFSAFLTTQKGALVAVTLMSLCLLMPAAIRGAALRLGVLAGAAAQILLPFVSRGWQMTEASNDVFTASSFAARVVSTWPGALSYIRFHSIGPFGVGIGTMGGPMRLITPSPAWMYADNMFIFVYAYFGVFCALYYGLIVYAVWRSLRLPPQVAHAALATLGFAMWYGTVITGLEDQITSLSVGMSIGCLLYAAALPVAAASRPVLRPVKGQRLATSPRFPTR